MASCSTKGWKAKSYDRKGRVGLDVSKIGIKSILELDAAFC